MFKILFLIALIAPILVISAGYAINLKDRPERGHNQRPDSSN